GLFARCARSSRRGDGVLSVLRAPSTGGKRAVKPTEVPLPTALSGWFERSAPTSRRGDGVLSVLRAPSTGGKRAVKPTEVCCRLLLFLRSIV
ncbi:MAG: hypothetical protein AAF550_09755, partial [Myxococcota bacterium]